MESRLIVLGGFAGAGKTTIGRRLSSELRIPFFSSDDFMHALADAQGSDPMSVGPVAYKLFFDLVKIQVSQGVDVILDSNMCSEKTWQRLDTLLEEVSGIDVNILILDAPEEVLVKRVLARKEHDPQHQDLKVELGTKDVKLAFLDSLRKRDGITWIDASREVEEVYQNVKQHIR